MRLRVVLTSFVASAFLGACGAGPTKPPTQQVAPPPTSTTTGRLGGGYASYPAAQQMVERLKVSQGFDPKELNQLLNRIERQPWILELVNRPPAPPSDRPTGSWTRYSAKFLNEDRIGKGLQFWNEHADTLERASRRYGVPPEYLVAIIGVETHYGRNMGKTQVIDALGTLAFDFPRRSEYFTQELEDYLVMTRNEGIDPFLPRGSYAGAMGYGQFMPSSFLRFAVDFDGDGKRDLWNPIDAIGSVGNYFNGHEWHSGDGVAIPASARGNGARLLKADYTTRYRVEELTQQGITSLRPLNGDANVSLLRLDGAGGYEYWLGMHNFYVITRYNHSTYYAMSVHQLAQQLRARRRDITSAQISWRDALPLPDPEIG